jgi:hypothetical protein
MSQVTTTIGRGTVVEYHGSLTSEHGEYVVLGDIRGRFALAHREYPRFELSSVRITSLTVTGDVADLCDCDHEYDWVADKGSRCTVIGCSCTEHVKTTPEVAVERQQRAEQFAAELTQE